MKIKPTIRLSVAEHYRRHHAVFTLALELGCTPKEAEIEHDRRESRIRWLASQHHLADFHAHIGASAPLTPSEPKPQPWWLRD